MRADTRLVVAAMAWREAAAALLPAPLVETGASGPSVRVRLVACPTCGMPEHDRAWAPPFTGPGPVLAMLACETLTARAVLPIVVASLRSPALGVAEFKTRALTWLEVAHLNLDKALSAVDAAERWLTELTSMNDASNPNDASDPNDARSTAGTPGTPANPNAMNSRTLPASTRPVPAQPGPASHDRTGASRPGLAPSFLSPHPVVPASLEHYYAAERRAAILAYQRRSR